MVTSGYGPRTARHGGARSGPARESQMIFISYGVRTGPVRDPQGCRTAPLRTRKGIDTTIICKNPARASYVVVRGPYAPLRAPHWLFTGWLLSLNPYGARKVIMHALKLYGPRTGGQNSYGATRDPHRPREWTYDFCSKQPGNNPGTTRTGPGSVLWLGHKHKVISGQYWKLHMIVLFRSSWYKYHARFRFYRVNFCYW